MYVLTSDLVPVRSLPEKECPNIYCPEYYIRFMTAILDSRGWVSGYYRRLHIFPGSDRLSNDFLVRNRYHGRVGD
jgi:hypothetical protein